MFAEVKPSHRQLLSKRIQLLTHRLDTQARQKTQYSRQFNAIQKAYPHVVISNVDKKDENDQPINLRLVENMPTKSDKQLSEGEVTPPDSQMLGDNQLFDGEQQRDNDNDDGKNDGRGLPSTTTPETSRTKD